jgi:hypothetical protein
MLSGLHAIGRQQLVDQAARAGAALAVHQAQAAARHIGKGLHPMRIAARDDQALAAPHHRQADMARRVQPAPQPALQLRHGPALRHMEAGHFAFVAAQFRQGFLAAAPEQFEADAAAVLDPVGQRQVVARRQPQALGGDAHHRRQQGFQPALPGGMHVVQRPPRRRVQVHQGGTELGQARAATAFHDDHRRAQRLLAVAQQAPGRAVGHAGLPRGDAEGPAGSQRRQ